MEIDPRYGEAVEKLKSAGFYFEATLLRLILWGLLISLCPEFWEGHFLISMAVLGPIIFSVFKNGIYCLCATIAAVLMYIDIRMSIKQEFLMKIAEIEKGFEKEFWTPKI